MDLVIFDIDGTLIHSHENEVECFIKAYTQVMGNCDLDTDLSTYEHITDNGIVKECIYRHFQRSASPQELMEVEEAFLSLFSRTLSLNPPTVIPGIHELFDHLDQHDNVCLAIATGSYHRSALLKLYHASLLSHHPLASCDDHFARIEIMKHAKNRAHSTYGVKEFRTITYVGDGPWDIKASTALEWNFIAIASNYPSQTLQEWGAKHIIHHYQPKDTFLDLIFTTPTTPELSHLG